MSTHAQRIQEKAYDRRWLILTVLCVSLLVIVLDNSILNVALPTIQKDLDATSSDLQWIVDSYTLVFAGLLLTAGSLGDRFGRRGALQVGFVIFGIGSVAVGHGLLVGPAHLHPGVHGHRRRADHARHPLDHHQRVPGPRAGQGHRRLGRRGRPRRRPRPAHRRLPGRALLLGLGVPREHPDRDLRPARRLLRHPHLEGPPRRQARPARRRALHRRAHRAALRHHRGAGEGLGQQRDHRRRHHRPACCWSASWCGRRPPTTRCSTSPSSRSPGSPRRASRSRSCSSPCSARCSC